MGQRQKPEIFIGSSVEGLPIAYEIQNALEHDADCIVWPQGIFEPGSVTLHDLIGMTKQVDFAIFAFTPDDLTHYRNQEVKTVRDNVLFEFGLFTGKLGIERVFFMTPRHVPGMHLPTDLLGITPVTYDHTTNPNMLPAKIGSACHLIRRLLHKHGPIQHGVPEEELQRYIRTLESHARFMLSAIESSERMLPRIHSILGALHNEFCPLADFRVKGTTLFQLTEDGKSLVQIGCSGAIKDHAKTYLLEYNGSNPQDRSYVVDSFLSNQKVISYTGKKYGLEKELILSFTVAKIFVFTIHLLAKDITLELPDIADELIRINEDLFYYFETILERGTLP
ncbi:nucleotide-binding protein [Brevibacillus choshinensis]|uniref:Nucleotide-binding protein n=1 Tax=Brevibacillus choshinensis TaxID=54911 RepID=A0ABX7FPH0_BRECH|nr:nucleotide-binding protein [Brevibacillus choshinensis]QRG68134.1 nucleotide-binding protein [Brevibacillus choshinensis]